MMLRPTSYVKQQKRNWLEIPYDVMINILSRIGTVNILENAQLVCTFWYKICMDPVMWRVIRLTDFRLAENTCKHVVDRSKGQLIDITLSFPYSDLLQYVADRSGQLKHLKMVCGYFYRSWTDALMKFPLLEELNLYSVEISKEEVKIVGCYCPMLKTLKMNKKAPTVRIIDDGVLTRSDEMAIAIGQNLNELRHLELNGNNMTHIGLQVILDNCHHLETLDLRACFNIDLKGDLWRKCSKQIKHLKLPNDFLEDFSYFTNDID